MRRPPALYKWRVERPGRFYIVVRTASVRRRIRSSAPRELLRRPTILAGEEPTVYRIGFVGEAVPAPELLLIDAVDPLDFAVLLRASGPDVPMADPRECGILVVPRLRGGRWTTSSLGDHVQLSPL